jgi:hypothetical protein
MKPDAADPSDYNLNANTCIWFNIEEIRYVLFFIEIIYIIIPYHIIQKDM